MKKALILTIPMVLSGCDSAIDCNNPDIISKVNDAVISGFSLADPVFAGSFLTNKNTIIEITGKDAESKSGGVSQCGFSFKIKPPVASASEIYNTKPIIVDVSKNNGELIIDTRDNIAKKVYELIRNNNIEERNDGEPTNAQKELIKKAEIEKSEMLKEEERLAKIEMENKIAQEKANKIAEEKRQSEIVKIKSLNSGDYKLTGVNDIVFFYSAKKMGELNDEQYLEYFSPAYTNENDVFKKDEIRDGELNRVKAEFNKMRAADGMSIMYPMTQIGYSATDYFGMDNSNRYGFAISNKDPSRSLLSGFDVSNYTIDLSKTDFSNLCNNEGGSPDDYIILDRPGNVPLSVMNKNKLSSCIIELNDRESAREVYEQLSKSKSGYNSTKIAFIVDLYVDGGLENDGLRTYISNFELKLKNNEGQEKTYTTKKS